jgi:hypothetical protein
VRGATVAQDDGLEQRRPAQAVDVVDVDRRLQQLAHRLHVAVVRRRDQRRAAVAVGALQVGTGGQRQAQDLASRPGAG